MSNGGTQPATEAETKLLRENTRLQESRDAERTRYELMEALQIATRKKHEAAVAANTPLRARVAALEKQLSEAERMTAVGPPSPPGRTRDQMARDHWYDLLVRVNARLRAALSEKPPAVDGTTSDKRSIRKPVDAASAANKASDSSALEKALGALRAARDECDALRSLLSEGMVAIATAKLWFADEADAGTAGSDAWMMRNRLDVVLRQVREGLARYQPASGGAHVDGPKAPQDPEDPEKSTPRIPR